MSGWSTVALRQAREEAAKATADLKIQNDRAIAIALKQAEINDAVAVRHKDNGRISMAVARHIAAEECRCIARRLSIIPDTTIKADQPVSGGHLHGQSVDNSDQHNHHDRPSAGKS